MLQHYSFRQPDDCLRQFRWTVPGAWLLVFLIQPSLFSQSAEVVQESESEQPAQVEMAAEPASADSAPPTTSESPAPSERNDRARQRGSSEGGDAEKPNGPVTRPPFPRGRRFQGDAAGPGDGRPPAGDSTRVMPDREGAGPAGPNTKLSFRFKNAPWADVLTYFAERAGLTLDLVDVPPGTFTYLDSRTYTPTEALDVLNGYLLPRGFVVVRRNQFLVTVNIDDGIPPNLVPVVSIEDLPQRGRNELVSAVISVGGLDAGAIAGEVESLLGPQGTASAMSKINAIVVQDVAQNVQRIATLLSGDNNGENKELAFRSVPLKHITAADAERTIRRLFGLNQLAANLQQQANRNDQRNRDGNNRDGGNREGNNNQQNNNQPPVVPVPTGPASKLQVTADTRTNHLLIAAPPALLKTVEEVVKALDTNLDAQGNLLEKSSEESLLKVYTVAAGDIAQVSRTVSSIYPGVVVGEDSRYGRLHVQATPAEHDEIEKLVKQLGGDAGSSVTVIPLVKLDPTAAANSLKALFSGDGTRGPAIESDVLGRRLMVRGTPEQVTQVKALLLQLGEDGNGKSRKSGEGRLRKLNLGGRDPEELLPLLKEIWNATDPEPIRIVVPSRPNPVRDRKVPGRASEGLLKDKAEPQTDNKDRPAALPAPVANEPQAASGSRRGLTVSTTKSKSAMLASAVQTTSDAAPGETGDTENATLNLTIQGDEILATSSDPQTLDRFEELYETLTQSITPRTRWTVFYLRSADVAETAQLLEKLFPQSSVTVSSPDSSGSLFGGVSGAVSSIGKSALNATGLGSLSQGTQGVRMITDPRSNALFVTGPADKVREIEQMLELLDASELPETLRDRVPRSIAIEYADVKEVYDIVENLYRDKLQGDQAANQPGGRNFNPLALLLGGAAGGNTKPRGPDLSISADTRTNQLIVVASDSLFRQIETVVQDIDERAKEAQPAVHVVTLEKADPVVLQQAISSLMPKVKTSATRVRSSSTGGGGGTTTPSSPAAGRPQPPAGPNPQEQEAMRRLFEQQMRNGGLPGGGRGRGR